MIHHALMWAATFLAVFALDMCWVFYVRQVNRGSPLNAALWASFLFLTSAGATVSFVDNPWLLFPATAGAFLGTLAGVIKTKRDAAAGLEE